MSKVPPQLRELFLVVPQRSHPLAFRHLLDPAPVSFEDFLTVRQDVVQSIGEMRRRFRELASNLIDELLIALLDFFAEQIFQRSLPYPLLLLLWKIGDEVGDQGPREAAGLRVRVIGEERIDWSRAAHRPADRRARRGGRSHRGGGRRGRGSRHVQ